MTGESTVTIGDDVYAFEVGDDVSMDSEDHAIITAVDRENGTVTIDMLKRLYSSEKVQDLVFHDNPLFGMIRTSTPTRLAGCQLGSTNGAIGGAAVAVITTVAALEWLRQRKAQVAAAEGSDEVYRSLLSDFIVWLTALFAKMKAHANG